MKEPSKFKQLKKIHPELMEIVFDGTDLWLSFPHKIHMTKRDFHSATATYELIQELEETLK